MRNFKLTILLLLLLYFYKGFTTTPNVGLLFHEDFENAGTDVDGDRWTDNAQNVLDNAKANL